MSTDRELLEAAAKAYGVKLNQYPDEDFLRADHSPLGQHWNPRWNPLTDDGDALRLAVKLRIDVTWTRDDRDRAIAEIPNKAVWGENALGDPYAATRRAIVRAAAALADKQ